MSRNVSQGSGSTYAITVNEVNGYTGVVTLSVAGAPAGAKATISPTQITVGPSGASATVNVSTSKTAPKGNFTLTVTGTDGSMTKTVALNMHVKK